MNRIILITNQEEIRQNLQSNFVLLRESDKILFADYDNAPDILYEQRPDIVILHECDIREKTINLIKFIREKKIFKNSRILLLLNNYDKTFILSAYDEGIYDYLLLTSDSSEVLIRTINCIKSSEAIKKILRYEENLKTYGILDAKSGFYSASAEENIFDVRLHLEDYVGGSYIIVAIKENNKDDIASDLIIEAIKKSIRTNDLAAKITDFKYSILLKCGIDGALKVFGKIKSELSDDYDIHAGISVINSERFDEIKNQAVCALNNSFLKGSEYTVYSSSEKAEEDWLIPDDNEEKTYKLFKKAFLKKVEDIISPVFVRTKRAYEEKINGGKIEQFTDEQQSAFRIICGTNESRLTMRYHNYTKLLVTISHSGFDSPENRELSIGLKDITEDKIEELMDGFIDEFMGIYRHLYRNGEQ